MGFTPPGGGTPLAIKEEGVTVTAGATSLDFTGTGVTATAIGTAATANVPSGGGGTPGGSNTQVQYNNAGAFGGITGATTDGATLTLVAPVLGTPASGVMTNVTGTASGLTAGAVTNATLTTALTVNTGTVTLTGNVANTSVLTIGAGAVSVSGANTGDQTITLTGGVTGSGTGSFAATVVTNANLTGPITSVGNATSIAAQTGTGSVFVVQNTPTLTTPVLGVATATSINKVAITAPATSATLTIADGKTLAINDNITIGMAGLTLGNSGGFISAASKTLTNNNSITLSGTDATTMTFPTTSASIARTDAGQTFTGVNTFTSPKVITDISDTNGNEVVKITATASAVNEVTLANAATGNDPVWSPTGGDANVGLKLSPKGTGTVYGNQETLVIAISDETTAITTGTAKVTFYMPYAFNLVKVKASVTTVSSSGIPTFNLNDDGVSVFTTKVTIDANENFSDDATPSALTSTPLAIASGSKMTIDIDVAGTGATGAKLYIIGYATAKP